MSSIPKPWEVGFRHNEHSNRFLPTDIGSSSLGNNPVIGPSQTMPPPVPSRSPASNLSSSAGLNTFYGGMGPLGGGFYGGGIYGRPFGFGDAPFGSQGSANLTQLVESQLRPGFDSIYSIVQAFSSVSMMLESTYFALQNTVRAAVGMADHFNRIGSQLRNILITFPLISWLRTYIRRILHWLGLIKANPNNIWTALQKQTATAESGRDALNGAQRSNSTSWPILLFIAVAVGGPLLIWRLISSLFKKHAENSLWASGQSEHYVAKALFDFGASRDDELSFKAGDTLRIAPKDQQPNINGWLLAAQGQKVGLVPANHVNVLGRLLTKNTNPTDPAKDTFSEESAPDQNTTENSKTPVLQDSR